MPPFTPFSDVADRWHHHFQQGWQQAHEEANAAAEKEAADIRRKMLKHELDSYKWKDTADQLHNAQQQLDLREKTRQILAQPFQDMGQTQQMGPNDITQGQAPDTPMPAQPDPMKLMGTLPAMESNGTNIPEQPVWAKSVQQVKTEQDLAGNKAQEDALDLYKAKKSADQENKYIPVAPGGVLTKDGKVVFKNPKASGLFGDGGGGAEENAALVDPTTGRNEDVLKKVPQQLATIIKGAANYELDPTKITSMRGDQRLQLVAAIKAYDPSFDLSQYGARQKLRNSFIGDGPAAQNIRAINTAIAHLGLLKQKFTGLNNTQFPIINQGKNIWNSEVLGKGQVAGFNLASTAVSDELGKAFKGSGSLSDSQVKQWKSELSNKMSQEGIDEAAKSAVGLLSGRARELEKEYEQGMKKPKDFTILSPESVQTLTKLGIDPSTIESSAGTGSNSGAGNQNDPLGIL